MYIYTVGSTVKPIDSFVLIPSQAATSVPKYLPGERHEQKRRFSAANVLPINSIPPIRFLRNRIFLFFSFPQRHFGIATTYFLSIKLYTKAFRRNKGRQEDDPFFVLSLDGGISHDLLSFSDRNIVPFNVKKLPAEAFYSSLANINFLKSHSC